MKTSETKNSKKGGRKTSKQQSKSLEANISDKVEKLIKSLGYDADNLGKGIKKASKLLVEKIAIKVEKLKAKADKEKAKGKKSKTDAAPVSLTLPQKKSRKVTTIKKAGKVSAEKEPVKRAYKRRTMDTGSEMSAADKPVAAAKAPVKRAYKRRAAEPVKSGATTDATNPKPVNNRAVAKPKSASAAKSKTTPARRGRKPKTAPQTSGAQTEDLNPSSFGNAT